VPRTLVPVDKMPLLGTGKIDHTVAKSLAEVAIATPSQALAAD